MSEEQAVYQGRPKREPVRLEIGGAYPEDTIGLPGGGYLVNAPVESISIPTNRLRAYRDPQELAASIAEIGLLHPITITESGVLVSGRHRLEAVRALGWEKIPAFVVADDPILNRIHEIDENLKRLDLAELERAAHYAERERLMRENGERRTVGGDAHSAKLAGWKTTPELAAEHGDSERTYYRRKSIGERIPEDLREEILDAYYQPDSQCNLADNQSHLNYLAGVDDKEDQREIAHRVLAGAARDVFEASKTLSRDKNAERRNAELERNREQVVSGTAALPTDTFQTIVIDPPWDWGDEGDVDQFGIARPTYATMTINEIAALPVGELAEKNAHIYLWITNRSLPKGFRLLEEWGFRYITAITWVKPSFGLGNYYRGSTEHVLFGVKGSLGLSRRDLGTHFTAKRPRSEAGGAPRHSAKPQEFYEMVESASPGPFLEIFARADRPGWKVWGAEVEGVA